MINFIKKHGLTALFAVFFLLILIPQSRMQIQVFIQKLIAFSPKELPISEHKTLTDYNLVYEDDNKIAHSLKDEKGKIIVINFWATWCPPCVAEMPSFSKIHQDYADRVSFYFITQDSWDLINKFESKRKYNLPYYKLIHPSADLDYTALPITYIIDKYGKIRIEKTGTADWNSNDFRDLLDKLIKE